MSSLGLLSRIRNGIRIIAQNAGLQRLPPVLFANSGYHHVANTSFIASAPDSAPKDHLVERKVSKDEKDWKKTAVAFANSAPVGLPAVLYIGVRNNGEIETPQPNLDEIQRRFNLKMQRVYPRISYVPKIINENGRQALAVIIPGSELRPHFAGPSYVRRGSQTDEASEEQFAELIAQRNSKAAHILRWKNNQVTVVNLHSTAHGIHETVWSEPTIVKDCNQFYVTFQTGVGTTPGSFPLSRIELNFDNHTRRLRIEIQR